MALACHGEAGETSLALERLGALDDEGWPDRRPTSPKAS